MYWCSTILALGLEVNFDCVENFPGDTKFGIQFNFNHFGGDGLFHDEQDTCQWKVTRLWFGRVSALPCRERHADW